MDPVWAVLALLVGALVFIGALKRTPRDDQRRIPSMPDPKAPAMPAGVALSTALQTEGAPMDPNALRLLEITLKKAERAEAEALALRIVCASLAAHIVHSQRDTGRAMAELSLTINAAVASVAEGSGDQPALKEALGKVPANVLEMAGELLGGIA